MKNKIWMATLAVLALFHPLAQAQDQGLGDMMFTAGTVTTDGSGQEWAWLQWMATDSALLQNRPMDIHWKAGDATSGNAFALKGTARQVADPRSIALLLARGETLGENLVSLEGAVDSLYAGAEPIGSLSLSEKLAALINGSQDDSELYNNLVFMGRAHPAISMAIGQGFACKIPNTGYSTFEVRDSVTQEIIGRVILAAGNPEILPAPGPIVRVPETTPMGNLNIRLRWDIPDDLKRLSLLQFGYNLYRVEEYAATKWWGPSATPASTAELLEFVNDYGAAKKVNRMPILVDAALTTSNTWYAVDDNDGQSPGGTPFVDGVEYYYYVTALDLLGRDGDISTPFLTFPCDRFAPVVPHGIETRTISEYNSSTRVRDQYVEVSWDHDTNDVDTVRYYVYRHTSLSNMQENATFAVSNRISGALVPAVSATRMTYEDHSLSTSDYGVTYWYTVRAEDDARCVNNLSGNSAPAYGLLRDWEGPPPASTLGVAIQIGAVNCSFKDHYNVPSASTTDLELACTRVDPKSRIAWAEFSYMDADGAIETAVDLGRYYFAEGEVLIKKMFTFPYADKGLDIICRVGDSLGRESAPFILTVNLINLDSRGLLFEGTATYQMVPSDTDPGPHEWGEFFEFKFPIITVSATPTAKTCRLYRRIDGGRRTLIYQGEMPDYLLNTNDYLSVTNEMGGSVNGGAVCYYSQLFDEQGNAGPMEKITCIKIAPRVDLPIPNLSPIDSTGSAEDSPGLELKWFCTVPGVERFEVAIAVDGGPLPSSFGVQEYELQGGRSNSMNIVVGGETNTFNFGFYRTSRVGETFAAPNCLLNSSIEIDRDYIVMVRAIGTVGTLGPWSNVETFHWATVPAGNLPQVPWPARPIPVVQESEFHPRLEGIFLTEKTYENLADGRTCVGIRIGELPSDIKDVLRSSAYEVTIPVYYKTFDLMSCIYTNALDSERIMPCVLYRYQMTNDLYRSVSGDVVQVSPLMEEIAWGIGDDDQTCVRDPFITISRLKDSGDQWGIFLIDTQPVVRETTYQYLLVRFDEETKEMDRIIPVGSVTVP